MASLDEWKAPPKKRTLRERFQGLSPMVKTPMLGFGYGFCFGSTIGILGSLGDLLDDEIRMGKRFKNVAKTGTQWGAFCGVLVAGGFVIASSRYSK